MGELLVSGRVFGCNLTVAVSVHVFSPYTCVGSNLALSNDRT